MKEISTLASAFDQIKFMIYEIKLIVNHRWWRWVTCWLGGCTGVIISYRLDRFGFMLFNRIWPALRILFYPLFLFLRLISHGHEIHYSADIGKGLKILHPSLGVVVSGYAVIGLNLELTGGNCIGGRKNMKPDELVIGNNVSLGANAVILGPIKVGDCVQIGAGAVVVESAPDNCTLVGVPAKVVQSLR